MTADWIPPKGDVELFGTITYRCYSCGELIEGDHVLAPLDEEGRVTSDTRAYHPEHAPGEEVTNGS